MKWYRIVYPSEIPEISARQNIIIKIVIFSEHQHYHVFNDYRLLNLKASNWKSKAVLFENNCNNKIKKKNHWLETALLQIFLS